MSTAPVVVKIDPDFSEFDRAFERMSLSAKQFVAQVAYSGASFAFQWLRSLVDASRDETLLDDLAEARDRYYLRRDLLELG